MLFLVKPESNKYIPVPSSTNHMLRVSSPFSCLLTEWNATLDEATLRGRGISFLARKALRKELGAETEQVRPRQIHFLTHPGRLLKEILFLPCIFVAHCKIVVGVVVCLSALFIILLCLTLLSFLLDALELNLLPPKSIAN